MRKKHSYLKKAKLYLILDTEVMEYDQLFDTVEKTVSNGIDIIQIRDKKGHARETLRFAEQVLKQVRSRVPLIINDRIDIAVESGADGVHLGQEDLPVDAARKILGPGKIIGVSCQTIRHAVQAKKAGADYIGFGSVFETLTKPERTAMDLGLLSRAVKEISIPTFFIGGINLKNLVEIKKRGIMRVAVTRAILEAKNATQTTRNFKKILEGVF